MNFFRGNLKAKNNKNLYMLYQGVLTKMETEFNKPIQYYLVFKKDYINVNQLLDKTIKISFIKHQCFAIMNRYIQPPFI